MEKALFLLSLSFIVTAIPGCDRSNPANRGNPSVLVPLKTGNSWVRESWEFDSTGAATSTFIDSMWASADTVVNGEKYFVISEQGEGPDGALLP